ncbi:hypothetical protein [Streptomyces sp. NPDC047028]|uniref:hypothetical protein n=1 Tax=Streptomyces sp. NPDC047028 TaxID=3155793 RepID=UPI0033E17C71
MKRFDDSDFGLTWLMAMFHQDWSHNGATGEEAARYHLVPDLEPEAVLAIRQDAQSLLDNLDAAEIEAVWQAGTCPEGKFFNPRWGFTTGPVWMETLIQLCDAWLAVKPDVRPLTGESAADGADMADAVLAEIDRTRFLPDVTRHALAECVRRCSPDLAFRLLLRAISEVGLLSGASLDPDQYARLESIGSALQYGEFVVDNVKYLVEDE